MRKSLYQFGKMLLIVVGIFSFASSAQSATLDWDATTKNYILDKMFELKTDKTSKEFLLVTTLPAKFSCQSSPSICKYIDVKTNDDKIFVVVINPGAGNPEVGVPVFILVEMTDKSDASKSIQGGFGFKVKSYEIDPTKCSELTETFKNKCNLGIQKPDPGNFYQNCQSQPPKFVKEVEKLHSYGSDPSKEQCIEMYTLFYYYTNSIPDLDAGTDIQKCIKELVTCSSLFQSCQGDTGSIKINDLENQCKEFLQGGAKKWDDLKGKNFCSDATKLKGTIEQQCAKYAGDVKEAKTNYKPPPRDYMFDEEADAVRLAQKGKIEGLAKSTFHLIGDRTPQQVFGGFIKALMGILGSIALGMFVYGGFMIMGAGGNSERIGKGTQIVIWSALGVVVIFASYTLVQFVLDVI